MNIIDLETIKTNCIYFTHSNRIRIFIINEMQMGIWNIMKQIASGAAFIHRNSIKV